MRTPHPASPTTAARGRPGWPLLLLGAALAVVPALAQDPSPPDASGPEELPVSRTIDQIDPAFWEMTQARIAPLEPAVYCQRAVELLSTVRLEDALQAVQLLGKARRLAPEDPRVLATYVQVSLTPYRWTWDRDEEWLTAARKAQQEAEDLAPELPEVRRSGGMLAMLENHLTDAEESLRAALAVAPGDVESLLLLGAVLRLQDRYREAYDLLGRVIDADPADWRGYAALGDAYRDDQWYEEALALYRKALELNPAAFAAEFGTAVVYHRVGFRPKAARNLQDLEERFPEFRNLLRFYRATLHLEMDQADRAVEALEQVRFGGRRGLCDGSMWYRMGIARMRLGDGAGAAEAWRRVVEEYPDARDGSDYGPLAIFPASVRLARAYDELGKPQEATDVLLRASIHDGSPPTVQLEAAARFASFGMHAEASAALRRGIAAEGDADRLDERVRMRVELARALTEAGLDAALREEGIPALRGIAAEVEATGTAVDCYDLARGFALAGLPEDGVRWLRVAAERHFAPLSRARTDPDLRSLRELPGFRALMRGQ